MRLNAKPQANQFPMITDDIVEFAADLLADGSRVRTYLQGKVLHDRNRSDVALAAAQISCLANRSVMAGEGMP
jgi:hypothetical protein